jgi:methionyl-tRNA synthetase
MNFASNRQFETSIGAPGPITAIIAPPPTPNGDLHLGHLAGPYLGADVLLRYMKLIGHRCVGAISVDLNQSYVVTTAERLKLDPADLADLQFHRIQATLAAANIRFDVVGMPDADYTAYVQTWCKRLYAAGAFETIETTVPYDPIRGRYLFEGYASGCCPTCLAPSKGNICEACGHPNEAAQLFNLYPTGGHPGEPVEMRRHSGLVLNLERWRKPLARHLLTSLPQLRPALRRLIDELLAGPLPAFPITFPSDYGIPAPFPNCDGHVLNVWVEMVPGHYWWLERAHAAGGGTSPLIGGSAPVTYLQCLGFDNSFFYACAHLALAFAAQEAGAPALIPQAIITNEFYQLDGYKFSSSQGHAIWGRDFLKDVPVDEARFYFAWSNPELQVSNFSRAEFELIALKEFRKPLSDLYDRLSCLPQPLPPEAYDKDPMATALLARFASAYDPARPSLRIAAQTLASALDIAVDRARGDGNCAGLASFITALAIGASPLVPATAASLWFLIGNTGPLAWPAENPMPSRRANDVRQQVLS